MSSNTRLAAVLLLLVAAAVLVWQLASRGSPAPGRAAPARGAPVTEEKPADHAEAPEPAPPEAGKPAEPPAKEQGVRVRVVAGGKPVLDAQVHATAGDTLHEFVHEGEGAYFAGATGKATVGVTHARFGPVRRDVTVPEGAVTELTLELPAGETLDVLVVADPGGAPVEGAAVYVIRAGGPGLDGPNASMEDPFDGDEKADVDFSVLSHFDLTDLMALGGLPSVAIPKLLTDGSGRARLTGLPPGTVDLVVSHRDFVSTRAKSQRVGGEAVVRLGAGGSLTVIAPLVEGRAAEGYLCGAVRPGLMLSMPVSGVRVDAEGKAFFAHLPPGPLRILFAKASHPIALFGLAMGGSGVMTVSRKEEPDGADGDSAGEPGTDEPEPAEEVDLKPLATANVTIVALEHKTLDMRGAMGARIVGVFVAGEKAREGAMVLLLSGEELRQQVAMSGTEEDGRFSFEGVAPGRYRVKAAGASGGTAQADCEVKAGDTVTVRLEMPLGAVAGRVLGADGKPAKGARVLVTPREAPRGQAANMGGLLEQFAGGAEADEEGRFRADGVAVGEYRVLAAVGHRLDVAEVVLREGEVAQVELRLDDARLRRLAVGLRGPGGPVEGTVSVVGADGGSAEMLALLDEENLESPKAAATHEFFLAPGRYRLVAQSAGLAPVLGEAVDLSSDRNVTLVLGPGVRVDLVLEGPDGPLANREADLRNEHGIRLMGQSPIEMLLGGRGLRTDGDGALALEAVPPGRYTLSVDGKERARVEVAGTAVAKRIRIE